MDAKRELTKIKNETARLNLTQREIAIRAGLHKDYLANAFNRVTKDPKIKLWRRPLFKLHEALNAERRKQDGQALQQLQAASLPITQLPSHLGPIITNPVDLVVHIDKRCKELNMTLASVSRSLGLSPFYLTKMRERVTDPKWVFRAKSKQTLQAHLDALDKIERQRQTPQPVLVESRVANQGELPLPAIGQTLFDDEEVARLTNGNGKHPVPKVEVEDVIVTPFVLEHKQSANDIIKGLIVQRLDGMGLVQLSLLLARIVGDEGK